jgi:predicted amidohydrolase
MTTLRLGVLAYDVTGPRAWDEFAEKFSALVAEGAAGADWLLMPEYACMEAAGAAAGDVGRELQAVCDLGPRLLALFIDCARRDRVWLLPGTLPWRAKNGGVTNRAPVITPEGAVAWQDKSVMTRFESERWSVQSGAPPGVFETPWGRIGVAICYDVEFPTLVRAQTEAGAWLILTPSCTDTPQGFNRVYHSARARALENQCFVAVAPTVGMAPGLATLDENHGYAGIFGPMDRGFAVDGEVARGTMNAPGWLFAALDPATLWEVRQNGAVRNFVDWPAAALLAGVNLFKLGEPA